MIDFLVIELLMIRTSILDVVSNRMCSKTHAQ